MTRLQALKSKAQTIVQTVAALFTILGALLLVFSQLLAVAAIVSVVAFTAFALARYVAEYVWT